MNQRDIEAVIATYEREHGPVTEPVVRYLDFGIESARVGEPVTHGPHKPENGVRFPGPQPTSTGGDA